MIPGAWLLLALIALPLGPMAAPGSAAAQDAARPDAALDPIPLAEVTARAEEVGALLRTLDPQLPPDGQVARIESELPALSERLTQRFDRTRRTIETRPGLGTIDALADSWQSSRLDLRARLDTLTTRAIWLDQQRQRLTALEQTWSRTQEAYATGTPDYLIERVGAVRSAVGAAQARVSSQRGATLQLQDSVAREVTRCDEALALLGQARRRATSGLFAREIAPIWSPVMRSRALSEVPGVIGESFHAEFRLLRRFVADEADRMVLHGGLIVGLVALFWWARRRAREWRTQGKPSGSLADLFEQPVAAALLLGLLSTLWIYSDVPRGALVLVEIGTLLPVVVILRRLLPPAVRPGLYALAGFFLLDRLRDLATILPLLERAIFLVEMLAAVVVLGWAWWSGRLRNLLATDDGSALGRARGALARVAFWGFVTAFVAGAIGTMSLARLLGSGILASGYMALVLTAGRRLADGLVAFALRVWPLRRLKMVEHHRSLLERRAHVGLRAVAITAWVAGTLDVFGVLESVMAGGRRFLTAELTTGALRLSVGDVLAFAVTIYAAFLFSSLVRFVLAEDVFPRLQLRPGLPYALSSLLGYAIVFAGFILALAAVGVNLDRITLLGGAFGIGVGFGLQNIVNNFVSGLIVLFERPVRVGDAVQIGDVQGEVRRIGIRSTTVRAWEGAEVIVPNSMLVSDRVTNWTPADQSRRLDIPVNVAYGTAPDKVLKVLAEVAHGHPDVAPAPAPQSLFLGFGDSALRFELRVWTGRLDRHVAVKSELGIAVYAALREAEMTIPLPQQEIRVYQDPPPR
ncbi:MAG: mechanosensitive ion channel domain-containing protein [Candidatus Rokuibacteriota bacterium]